jgi:hypothetical protein
LKKTKEMVCEQPLKRWIHADGSKLSMKDSVKIFGQLVQIAWAYRPNKKRDTRIKSNKLTKSNYFLFKSFNEV